MLYRIKDMKTPEARRLGAKWEAGPVLEFITDCPGRTYMNRALGLRVIHSYAYVDDQWWDYISVSRARRLPTWEDLKLVKDLIIGKDREAIQVLPKEEEFVNIHPHCLHLWCVMGKQL